MFLFHSEMLARELLVERPCRESSLLQHQGQPFFRNMHENRITFAVFFGAVNRLQIRTRSGHNGRFIMRKSDP